jgi:hypothetical protein
MTRRLVALAAPVFMALPPPAHAVVTTCKKPPCRRAQVRPHLSTLNRIAWCESRNRWHINAYHDGGLQFHPSTWRATGSRYRFAHWAPKLEQQYRAVVWAERIGWAWGSTAGWPNCAGR